MNYVAVRLPGEVWEWNAEDDWITVQGWILFNVGEPLGKHYWMQIKDDRKFFIFGIPAWE